VNFPTNNVRGAQANEPIFIALDGRYYGKRLSGRSVARVVDWVATDAGVTKHYFLISLN
jgi:hypothetical protein